MSVKRCLSNDTIIGTPASLIYLPQLVKLAKSVQLFGFGCVATLPVDALHEKVLQKYHHELHVFPTPSVPVLPEPRFCNTSLYGWRRVHLLKMHLWWHIVVRCRFHLLSIDANYMMDFNPVPTILAMPFQVGGSVNTEKRSMDVIGVHDGISSKMINIGLVWIRSTQQTRRLVLRTTNRTWGAWDQYVFNDELNFNTNISNIGCCVSTLLKRAFLQQPNGDAASKNYKGSILRRTIEGPDICANQRMPTAHPDPKSRYFPKSAWNSFAYNKAQKINHRRYGRCTRTTDRNIYCIL